MGVFTTIACFAPSPETTVSWMARNAGAETFDGLTELARIVNVAGTRAFAEPPAGVPAEGPGELSPSEPFDGWALTPPELDVLVVVRVLVGGVFEAVEEAVEVLGVVGAVLVV